ncbi:MAG: hypothetical protein R3F33_18055 [Planctomycetota bacterium]
MLKNNQAALRGGWANGPLGVLVSGALMLAGAAGGPRTNQEAMTPHASSKVVQAQAFEVVDGNRTVVSKFAFNENGGNLALYRDLHEDNPHIFAYLGCPLGGVDFMIRTQPNSQTQASGCTCPGGPPLR